MHRLILALISILLVWLLVSCSAPMHTNQTTQSIPDGPIQNLHALTPTLYSGGEPASEAHYQQLAQLGIRTVISVDAIAPNPELAAPHDIRIVHLPIGYSGIDDSRATELAHALRTLEHPIYLHCHHGKHRGPAAICVGAIGAGMISNEQASEFMTLAGTSKKYPGLWESARNAQSIKPSDLDAQINLPARAPVRDFVDAMGKLDRLHDRLRDIAANDWKTLEDHPDLSATAVSGQIHDLLRSMQDAEEITSEGYLMRSLLDQNINDASATEQAVRENRLSDALDALNALKQSCTNCHDQFRDSI